MTPTSDDTGQQDHISNSAAPWSPVYESDVPLGWPSRDAFLEWLSQRDKAMVTRGREEERIRADKAAVDWMNGHEEYGKITDRLFDRLRFAMAQALSEEGM